MENGIVVTGGTGQSRGADLSTLVTAKRCNSVPEVSLSILPNAVSPPKHVTKWLSGRV